ncbi:NADH-quinone oxidoreductase subunit J, partial [Salmonella sp. s51090]|uniref:NADH-quinone oxidoreductase subunit J n=1 Tax=Salmonella sp. s51090 TaxID=3159651 RepID=UPI00397F9E97
LTLVSISRCLILLQIGTKFLALILLLVYMGGMLIVFIYSRALRTDRFPLVRKIKEIIIFRFFILI